MIAAEATNYGLIGTLIGITVTVIPGYIGLRRYRSDRDHTDAETKQINTDAAGTIVKMATEQLASYERQIANLQAEIAQMRAEHAAEMLQVRAELLRMEERLGSVLAENHVLRTKVTRLESGQ